MSTTPDEAPDQQSFDAQMRTYDLQRYSEMRAANEEWRQKIDEWSRSRGFAEVESKLWDMWPVKKITEDKSQYATPMGLVEIDRKNRTCRSLERKKFGNGMFVRRDALGLATALLEINGHENPGRDAKTMLVRLSGIRCEYNKRPSQPKTPEAQQEGPPMYLPDSAAPDEAYARHDIAELEREFSGKSKEMAGIDI